MIKKLLLLFLLFTATNQLVFSQAPGNNCGSAVALTLPTVAGNTLSTGAQTTNGRGNNYAAGTYCTSALYGGGADGVYSINVPAGGGNYTFTFPNSGNTWKILSIHSACPITNANCIDGFTTGGGTGGTTTLGLAAGTYYLVIDTWPTPNFANFTLNITYNGPPPPPPSNDDPCGAIPLTVNTSCSFSTYSTLGATGTTGVPAPGCAAYAGGDVWFTTTVPASGNLIIDTIDYAFFDSGMAIYSVTGACPTPTLTLIECDDDGSANPLMSSITWTGLTPGDTIYIRFWDYGNFQSGDFGICVSEPPPPCTSAVTPITTPSCPFVDVTPDTSTLGSCGSSGSSSETLTADFLDLGDTSDYDVDLIPYDTATFASLAAAATNPVAITADDTWSNVAYPIPFDFCFYGNTVTDFVVGANGIISFDTGLAGLGSGFSFDEGLPSTDQSLFENAIYAVYHDIDPSVNGTITYGMTAVGGCNVMVVLWDDIAMYENGNFGDNTKRHTAMAVLYEDTNIIEVLIEEKVIDDIFFTDVWNEGNAIVGIQNPGATQAVVAPCRNTTDGDWTATNEAWRFTPSGGASIANLQWLVNGVLNATYNGQTSISVSPTSTTTYTAQVTYTLCNSTTLVISDNTTVTVGGGKIWDGSETTNDWMEPLNWSDDAIPTATDCVVIPVTGNDPVIYTNDNGDGLNMAIYNGATLTVETGASVTIQDWIDLQGNSEIYLQDGGSLIQVNEDVIPNNNNTGSGTLRMDRTADVRLNDYVYWSSPVGDWSAPTSPAGSSNVSSIATTPSYRWIPTVNQSTIPPANPPPNSDPFEFGEWEAYNGLMEVGKGYIVRSPIGTADYLQPTSQFTHTFTGFPNNGRVLTPIQRGDFTGVGYFYFGPGGESIDVSPSDDNWNLVGNPYPSAISADLFIQHNAAELQGEAGPPVVQGTVHLWTHGTDLSNLEDSPFYQEFEYNYTQNDYISYNSTGSNPPGFSGFIASGQGFFVEMDNATSTNSSFVEFTNSMRSLSTPGYTNSNFYRTASNGIEKHRIWLDLLDTNNQAKSILIGYVEGATQNVDRLFDGHFISVPGTNFYSFIDDSMFSIQGRSLPFYDTDTVPLGLKIPVDGNYTIAINSLDGLFEGDNGQNIYLEDSYVGFIHNLRTSPYSFNIEEGNFNDRFILRYTNETLGLNELELGSGLTIVAPNSNYIKVNSQQSLIQNVIVYDLLGRVLFDKHSINQSEFILNNHNLSVGTYIVKATLINGQSKAQKIVLKN